MTLRSVTLDTSGEDPSHRVDRHKSLATRREFLAAAALVMGRFTSAPLVLPRRPTSAGLDLLILGGTGFIGPHLVSHALARGHRVTTFTRGRRDGELPSQVTRLIGDRNGQLDALEGKRWDAVIDDSATNPDWVRQSTELLALSVGRYLFTSSTGVYYPYLTRGLDETAPLRYEIKDEKDGSEVYAVRKAQCEQQTQQVFGDRATIVRPTYIVGPGDTTDRFPYWPVRLARGGDTLAPGRPDDPVQIVDVRDLVAFMVKLLEEQRGGIYSAAGPAETLTFGQFLTQAHQTVGSTSRFTWVDDFDLLLKHGIEDAVPWIMLRGNDLGHTSIRNDRARAAGLRFRPLADTVKDTLTWWPTVPEARRAQPRFSITPEKEAAVLAEWRARGQ
jgi:2'-hydroxyisoflavone reductase